MIPPLPAASAPQLEVVKVHPFEFLDKICEIKYGSPLSEREASLKEDLIRFLKSGDFAITRQAILNWFKRKRPPSRDSSLIFLHKYLDACVDKETLSGDRKNLYYALLTYIRNKTGTSDRYSKLERHKRKIIEEKDVGLLFRFKRNNNAMMNLYQDMPGIYYSYHHILSRDTDLEFTQEILRIFKTGDGLGFELWYLKDGATREKYNGVIFVYGNIIWLIGATSSEPDRIRMMNFKYVSSTNKIYSKFRCGLMLSDIPVEDFLDPVACRIVLLKADENRWNASDLAAKLVRNFTKQDVRNDQVNENVTEKTMNHILRLIDNKNPASNKGTSLLPDKKHKDNVLKVDQRAVHRICQDIFGK